ncbi:MAG: GNAT family N-acetyltransferase [Deferribacteres bacterium]|nr:GNAT family N-acetyltransferase [Deferribacteres bacterium]
MILRSADSSDLPFIKAMLFEAIFWDPKMKRPDTKQFLSLPEIAKLLANWGKAGDYAVIADESGSPVGAGWFRLGTEEEHSWGYVDEQTPELGLAVVSVWRSCGIGRKILQNLRESARQKGYKAISLSVAPENFALQLYQSEGFFKIGESGTSSTMLLHL